MLKLTTSVWMATANTPIQPRLRENIRTDVCIVGAGIAGMTTAHLLAKEGRSVVVLDDGAISGGMTGRTTAHLTNAYDDGYVEMEKLHGAESARLIAASHTAAIDTIEEIARDEEIDCGFERLDGYLFVPPDESAQILKDELEAARRAGLAGVEIVERAPIETFDTGQALRFREQAQFHPLEYLTGLTRAITRNGGRIFSETHVIMREGLMKVAVYRDESGTVHRLSAVCPHLGCVVAWNSTEKTWDCPCHGSKYRADGRVYQGPANSDLSSA